MPEWLMDLNKLGAYSSIAGLLLSIAGLAISIFLLVEARKIRNDFLLRARLPELNKELVKAASSFSANLKTWKVDKNPALESLSKIKALLENIQTKLNDHQKKKVEDFIDQIAPREFLIIKRRMSHLSEDAAWSLYSELSGLITSLQQYVKDSKWG